MQIHQVFFVSRSTHRLGHISDLDIMRTATAHNQTLEITGFLLRGETWYSQVLEGELPRLRRLMVSIRRDPRHYDVENWWLAPRKTREFPKWHTDHWGLSEQTHLDVYNLLRCTETSVEEKLAFIKALAQRRRYGRAANKTQR